MRPLAAVALTSARVALVASALASGLPAPDTTNLGLAMLIAESEDGQYAPVGVVASIGEAREIAESDLKNRSRRLKRDQDPGLCPYTYKVWANGIDGDYRIAVELTATKL